MLENTNLFSYELKLKIKDAFSRLCCYELMVTDSVNSWCKL